MITKEFKVDLKGKEIVKDKDVILDEWEYKGHPNSYLNGYKDYEDDICIMLNDYIASFLSNPNNIVDDEEQRFKGEGEGEHRVISLNNETGLLKVEFELLPYLWDSEQEDSIL